MSRTVERCGNNNASIDRRVGESGASSDGNINCERTTTTMACIRRRLCLQQSSRVNVHAHETIKARKKRENTRHPSTLRAPQTEIEKSLGTGQIFPRSALNERNFLGAA